MAASDLISLDEFLPQLRMRVTSVEQPIAIECLRKSCNEFLRRSRIWRLIDTVTFVDGPIRCAPAYAELVDVERAWFDQTQLIPIAATDLDLTELNKLSTTATAPEYITQISPSEILIHPLVAGNVKVSMFLTTEAGARFGVSGETTKQTFQNRVPEFLFTTYLWEVMHGALAEVYSIPEAPYNNPEMAMFHMEQFNKRIDDAKDLSQRGQQRAPIRTRGSFV